MGTLGRLLALGRNQERAGSSTQRTRARWDAWQRRDGMQREQNLTNLASDDMDASDEASLVAAAFTSEASASALLQRYHTDGYVIFPPLLSATGLQTLRSEC